MSNGMPLGTVPQTPNSFTPEQARHIARTVSSTAETVNALEIKVDALQADMAKLMLPPITVSSIPHSTKYMETIPVPTKITSWTEAFLIGILTSSAFVGIAATVIRYLL